MRKSRLRAEIARLQAELDAVRPYLGLAREIHESVARLSDSVDAAPGSDAVAAAIDAIPNRERAALARAAFDRLPPQAQWEIVERVFGDAEVRSLLETERAVRLAHAVQGAARAAVAAEVRTRGQLDTALIPAGDVLTLGLFREPQVRTASATGRASSSCARRVVLRATEDSGRFQVLEDVFNPDGAYFVTAEYDESTWRAADRLPAHAVVRVGSISETSTGSSFSPTLFLGGRVDVEADGQPRKGLLHLGFALLGDVDLFAGTSVAATPVDRSVAIASQERLP